MVFKVPNVEDCDEVLKIIQTYITPVVFYPYNVCYFNAISIIFKYIKKINIYFTETIF